MIVPLLTILHCSTQYLSVVNTGDKISVSFCYWDSVLSAEGVEKVCSSILQALNLLFQSTPDDSLPKVSLVQNALRK
jgi:hypothetical protein